MDGDEGGDVDEPAVGTLGGEADDFEGGLGKWTGNGAGATVAFDRDRETDLVLEDDNDDFDRVLRLVFFFKGTTVQTESRSSSASRGR